MEKETRKQVAQPEPKPVLADVADEDLQLLKNFIDEFFPIKDLFKVGFFTKEMKGDYRLMAKRICEHFDYETVFEYGSEEIRCHISYLLNLVRCDNGSASNAISAQISKPLDVMLKDTANIENIR